jgi:hypothetical protein
MNAGASNMAGSIRGLQALLKDVPEAVYVHCYAHRLNLALLEAVENDYIINLRVHMAEVGKFFAPARRRHFLAQSMSRKAGPRQPKIPSTTRWTSLADVSSSYLNLYPELVDSLQDISNLESSFDVKTRQTAVRLRDKMLSYPTVLTAVVSSSSRFNGINLYRC